MHRFRKPGLPPQPATMPVADDDFRTGFHLGWQWAANPMDDWVDRSARGVLRLKAVSSSANLWEAGNVLTQKLPGTTFSATVKLQLAPKALGERAGLVVMGYDYGWIGLENTRAGVQLVQATRSNADLGVHKGAPQQATETAVAGPSRIAGPVYLRVSLVPVTVKVPRPSAAVPWPAMERAMYAQARFSYSLDGVHFESLGSSYLTQPGRWVGAQVGVFAQAPTGTPSNTATRVGHADFSDFRFTP